MEQRQPDLDCGSGWDSHQHPLLQRELVYRHVEEQVVNFK